MMNEPVIIGKATLYNMDCIKAMRDYPCANCGRLDGTVCAAHRNEGKGMGLKVSDALVAPLCSQCHHELDQGKHLTKDERRDLWNRAYIKNVQQMIEAGRLVLHG